MHRTRMCAGVAGMLVASWGVGLPPAISAGPAKVDLCHARGNGGFGPISVAAPAAAAHLAHGDGQPGGPAPGGYVFDGSCSVVTWVYGVNVPPDPSAQDPASPGNLFVGSGIPALNFGTAHSIDAGIELGLMVLYRQGPTVASSDDYADGVLHFDVNGGPQSTANGSAVNNATRASWNFTFSVAAGLDGTTTDLGDHTFELLYDVDPGPGTTYRTLVLEAEVAPQPAGQSGFQWRDQGTATVFISDDEGNASVTQNSENYAFGFFQGFLTAPYGPGNSFAGPARFDIILQALDAGQIVARNHVAVNVLP